VVPHPALPALREHCARQLDALPERFKGLRTTDRYAVQPSARLTELSRRLEAELSVPVGTAADGPREETRG
jgi:hypothetical protein